MRQGTGPPSLLEGLPTCTAAEHRNVHDRMRNSFRLQTRVKLEQSEIELACANTREFLGRRGWTIHRRAEARIETVKRYQRHAADIVELVKGGLSINFAADRFGISWQESRDAYAEGTNLSKPAKGTSRDPAAPRKFVDSTMAAGGLDKPSKAGEVGVKREVGRPHALRRADAVASYSCVISEIRDLRKAGLSYARIAERLNEEGLKTRRGKTWSPTQVDRVLGLCKGQPAAGDAGAGGTS